MNLNIKRCTYKATKYAVLNWHYSKRMPSGKLVKYGVWEDELFVGAVVFGRGANKNVAIGLKLETNECAELVRIALRNHKTEVTKIVSICLKMLKKENPGLKTIFSYADITNQQHQGIIYKAGNWKYHGVRKGKGYFMNTITNKMVHQRSLNARYKKVVNYPAHYKPLPKDFFLEKHFFTYDLR